LTKRTVSWLETLTRPKVIFRAGQRIEVYVPRGGFVFNFPVDKDGHLEKPRKRDRGQYTADLHHERLEGSSPQSPSGAFEAAWRQGYAVWERVKERGTQGGLF
jgi:hypothetical protein